MDTPTYAIIPAKYHSERIPHKNRCDLAGRPLWYWSVKYALQEGLQPVIYTDDEEIRYDARSVFDGVIMVNKECDDERDMSDAVRHVMEHLLTASNPTIVLLQPTSPLRRKGFARHMVAMHETNVDRCVLYSARKMKRIGSHNGVFNICYDDQHNDDWFYWFDGSVVVTSWRRFVENDFQLFDKTAVPIENTEPCPLQVDTLEELRMIRHLVQTDDSYLYEAGLY